MDRSRDGLQPSPQEVRTQLKKVLESKGFAKSKQRTALLRYFVEQTLSHELLKESVILSDVFPAYRGEWRFVSVVIAQVRSRLRTYYAENPHDPVLIELPSVSAGENYRAAFSYIHDATAVSRFELGVEALEEQSLASCRKAVQLLAMSKAEDPSLAVAHAAYADACLRHVFWLAFESDEGLNRESQVWLNRFYDAFPDLDVRIYLDSAQESAEQAIRLNPRLWLPHLILATVHACHYRWNEANAEFETAISLAPDDARTHPLRCCYLLAIGRQEESFVLLRERIEGAPNDQFLRFVEYLFHYVTRQKMEMTHYHLTTKWFHFVMELEWLNRDLRPQHVEVFRGRYPQSLSNRPFYLCGLEAYGAVTLREGHIFVVKDVKGGLQQYLDGELDWNFPRPQHLQRAIAYIALAIIKWHAGIPIKWFVNPWSHGPRHCRHSLM